MSLIPLNTAKQWLQISHSAEDTALQIVLDGLEEEVASLCAISFGVKSVSDRCSAGKYLWLSFNPVLSIEKISNNLITVTDFEWKDGSTPTNRVWKTNGCCWTTSNTPYPWLVEYTAGYSAQTLPKGLQGVILELLKHHYDSRGGMKSFSAAGTSQSWDREQIIKRLKPYSFRFGVS